MAQLPLEQERDALLARLERRKASAIKFASEYQDYLAHIENRQHRLQEIIEQSENASRQVVVGESLVHLLQDVFQSDKATNTVLHIARAHLRS